MEVIILAGGLGTRLKGVVDSVPKSMAPVAGKPFLYYLLHHIAHYKVTKVHLSIGYMHEKIEEWVEEHREEFPFKIDFVVEESPLGTGGAIELALKRCKEKRVVIMNGDTFFDVDLDSFSESLEGKGLISVALKPMRNFDRYGNVTLGPPGYIHKFKEKRFCKEGLINGGIYVVERQFLMQLFEALPEHSSFEHDILEAIAELGAHSVVMPPPRLSAKGGAEMPRGLLGAEVYNGYFIDIGVPDDYDFAQREFFIAGGVVDFRESDNYDTLFLDRDGVINRLLIGDYVKSWEEFEFLPGLLDALARWSKIFRHIIVVTNQRGVGRGVMSDSTLKDIHSKMVERIEASGGRIDAIYYSPALSESDPRRKPNTGMIEEALHDFPDIDLARSVMLGDSESDRQFALNAGVGHYFSCK